ncbi:MAG: PatB family C-S lyase [Oscillospiraceae bacterium]
MQYNFDEIIDRRDTGAMKTDVDCNQLPLGDGALSMWIADMDFACAPAIIEAIKCSADRRIFGYTRFGACCYFDALCDYYERRHRWHIDPADIVYSCGVVSALEAIVGEFSNKGDGIVIQPPVYPPFERMVRERERRVVENPLVRLGNHYEMDFADLRKKISQPGVSMMILCSPHNPVGRVWTRDELKTVYDICTEHGVLLVCDEIHCDLTRGWVEHIPLLRLLPNAQNIIVNTAPSKTFNLAGLGVSHAIIPNPMLRARAFNAIGDLIINPISVAAVRAAFSECDEWLDELCSYLDGNFALLRELLLRELPLSSMVETEGSYLAWVDFSAYRSNSAKFESELVEKAALSLEAGSRFGAQGEGFLRINLACPRATIEQAVTRISGVINGVE